MLTALAGFADPVQLALLLGGLTLGIFVGAVPGLTATLAIALLLPFTFRLPPVQALVTLTAIYIGGIYGGSITAITIRIPGAPANTMTILNGNAMARAGRTEAALGLATFSSFVGGVVAGLVLVFFAPQLARVALAFQSPESFSLMVLALAGVAAVSGRSLLKGLSTTVLGLMLSTVGLDKMLPVPRFTFGSTSLLVGVPLLPVVIGLFAVTELFWQVAEPKIETEKAAVRFKRILDFLPAVKKVGWKLFAKSSAIGTLVGALPGGGAAMAAFLAYTEAQRSSSHPEKFGSGVPEGIVAPETANNAVTGGAFIPMLALGIPGDAVTAVILGGLLIQGVTPGPQLFQESGALVWPLFIGYFLAYILLLVLGLGLLPWFSRLARVDRAVLLPLVAAVSVVAAYASERTLFGMGLTVVMGALGYVLRRNDFPLVPLLMGLILGPMLESNFRRALIVSSGDPLIFLRSPVSAALLIASALLVVYAGWRRRRSS